MVAQNDFPRNTAGLHPTAQALLDAGRELFADHGFDGVSIDMLARRAAANRAMVSYHFGGKEELYAAIIEGTFAPVHQRLARIRESEKSASDQLHDYFLVFADLAREYPGFPRMVLREVLAGGRRLRPEHLPNFFGVLTTLKFIIEKGVAEGVFRPLDPVTTFLIVNGGLIFFLSTEPFRQRILGSVPGAPQFPETDRFIEAMEQFVRRGLAPEARDSNNVKRSRR